MKYNEQAMIVSNEDIFSFDELFDLTELQKIQNSFSELTGVASIITLLDGTPVTQPSNFSSLCSIIRRTDKGLINCMKSDTHLSQMTLNSIQVHVQPCLSAGLWDSGVCFVVNGVHVGNWMIGQVRNNKLNVNNILEYGEIIGLSKKEVMDAYEKVTVMSSEKLKTITLFLDLLVKEISQKAFYRYKIKQETHKIRALEEQISLIKTSLEFSPHAVVVWNTADQFVEVNPAATRITGYTSEELLSMNISELTTQINYPKFIHHSKNVQNYGLASDELEIRTKSGIVKHVLVDTVKTSQGYIGFVNDISYRKSIENSLRQKQHQLEEAEKIARIGYAFINFSKGTWESSPMLDDIIGIDEHYDKKIANWINIIHPEMLPELKDYFLNKVIPQQITMDTEFKIIRQNDHQVRWLHVVAKPEFENNSGQIKNLVFTLQDITERKKWVDILYKNEALYRSILNTSPDVIAVVDLDGKVKAISPIARQMYGSEDISLIIDHSFFEFIAIDEHNRMKNNFRLMFDSYLGTIEYNMVRANGEVFPSEINGDIIRDSDGKPTGLVFIIRDIIQRKLTEENLIKSKEQLKEFAGHLQSIREEEKIALAREIHDDLGQILVAMKIDMGLLKKKLTNQSNQLSVALIDKEMTKMLDLTNKTIAIARRIMSDLRSETVNHLGFIETTTMYIENFRERFKIECLFENNVDEIEFSQEQTVALYRILQESLSNIVKHANASKVKVSLNKKSKTLSLCITDNGSGFDINSSRRINSYGLLGMEERVALLDGNLNIDSKVGEGTSICIEIPVVCNS